MFVSIDATSEQWVAYIQSRLTNKHLAFYPQDLFFLKCVHGSTRDICPCPLSRSFYLQSMLAKQYPLRMLFHPHLLGRCSDMNNTKYHTSTHRTTIHHNHLVLARAIRYIDIFDELEFRHTLARDHTGNYIRLPLHDEIQKLWMQQAAERRKRPC